MNYFKTELTENDYIILKYVQQHPNVDEHDIIAALKDDVSGLPSRLKNLAISDVQPKSNGNIRIVESLLTNTSQLNTRAYHLSSRGEAELQNYNVRKKAEKRDNFIKWITLVAAIVSATPTIVSALSKIITVLK